MWIQLFFVIMFLLLIVPNMCLLCKYDWKLKFSIFALITKFLNISYADGLSMNLENVLLFLVSC